MSDPRGRAHARGRGAGGEEARLRAAIEELPSGLIVADLETQHFQWNREALAIHGYHPDEDVPKFLARLVAEHELHTLEGEPIPVEAWPLPRLLRRESFRDYEIRVRNKRLGWQRVFSYSGVVLSGVEPPTGLLAITDITSRKMMEQAVRESEDRYRSLFDHMSMGFTLCRVIFEGGRAVDYVHEEANPAFEEHTGLKRSAILGRRITEVLPAVSSEGWIEMLGEVAVNGRAIHYEQQAQSLGRWFEATAYRPKPGYFAALLLDVTERRRALESAKAANEQLREADRRKDEFLAMLSHELRNPLTPIRNSVHILERATPGGEQAKRALTVINRQLRQMSRLIDDLLDVTRISRGKIRLQREPLVLNDVIRGTGEDHRQTFRVHEVELRVVVPEDPIWVEADRTRIAQVVGNLLQNADKFTPSGGWAELSLRADETRAFIEVRDSGAGIEPDLLSRLFEAFVQAEKTLDRSRGGLGLGLALVKGLVELHGGTVRAASDGVGRGAVFTIELPRLAVDDAER